jgi:hypothetical protein
MNNRWGKAGLEFGRVREVDPILVSKYSGTSSTNILSGTTKDY